MSKNGVYNFVPYKIEFDLNLKSKALFFEKLLVSPTTLSGLRKTIQNKMDVNGFNLAQAEHNLAEFEYLVDVGFLDTFSLPEFDTYSKGDRNLIEMFKEGLRAMDYILEHGKSDFQALQDFEGMCLYVGDILTKLANNDLKRRGVNSVYPIFDTCYIEDEGKKDDVLLFVLNKLPVPHSNAAWEQIFDFKNNADSKSKYYALVHWVTSVARNNRPINEINDEYNYLYDQYSKQLKLHSIKTSMSTLVIIVNAGIDIIASLGAKGVSKKLFSYQKSEIALIEEEMKQPGQEIAFIHKMNEVLG